MAKKYYIDVSGKQVTAGEAVGVAFDFTKDGGSVLSIRAHEIPGYVEGLTSTALQALLHGVSQKGGDSYAAAKNQPNPVAWAQEQVKQVLDSIRKGIWNAGRTGEGGVRVSLLARALHQIKLAAGEESTEAEAQAFVDSLTKEQVAEYKGKKKVARVLAQLSFEDAQKRLARAQAKLAAGDDSEDEDEDADEE